jgi:transposase
LLKRILSKEATIKEAAKEFGVNFSTAKAILQTYRKEGRIGKKKTRERNRKQKEDEDDFHVGSARKVQSMCDLEREV